MSLRSETIRLANICLTFLGGLVLGALLCFVLSDPAKWEERARAFLVAEIGERAADARVAALRLGSTLPLPSQIGASTMTAAEAELDAAIQQLIQIVAEDGCLGSCTQYEALRDLFAKHFALAGARAEIALVYLRDWSQAAYEDRRDGLYRDVLIFLGSNLAVMLLALALAVFRSRAAPHLLPISSLLFATTVLGSAWYLFGQNWVITILYSSYFGWSYLILLAIIFTLLLDIAFNRGRLITWAVNKTCETLLHAAPPLHMC